MDKKLTAIHNVRDTVKGIIGWRQRCWRWLRIDEPKRQAQPSSPQPDGRVRLDTANPGYPSAYYAPGEFRIEGRVVRLQRDLDPAYSCAVTPLESETDSPAVEPA